MRAAEAHDRAAELHERMADLAAAGTAQEAERTDPAERTEPADPAEGADPADPADPAAAGRTDAVHHARRAAEHHQGAAIDRVEADRITRERKG